jgi:hypothetical protein
MSKDSLVIINLTSNTVSQDNLGIINPTSKADSHVGLVPITLTKLNELVYLEKNYEKIKSECIEIKLSKPELSTVNLIGNIIKRRKRKKA